MAITSPSPLVGHIQRVGVKCHCKFLRQPGKKRSTAQAQQLSQEVFMNVFTVVFGTHIFVSKLGQALNPDISSSVFVFIVR